MYVLQHVVFGEILEGQKTLNMIEVEAASADGEPAVSVVVEDCGEVGSEETSQQQMEPELSAA